MSNELPDYYIIGTNAPQGATAKPTRFVIFQNDTGLSVSVLQHLTFALSTLYFGFAATIKIPAPSMYAHKISYLFARYLVAYASNHFATKLFYL